MANPEHVALLHKGREALHRWRRDHKEEFLDLRGANLEHIDLRQADLTCANFSDALLGYAQLSEAQLGFSVLHRAILDNAVLTETNLDGTDFTGVRMRSAWLLSAKATKATFAGADLTGSYLTDVALHDTCLARAVLSGARLSLGRLSFCDMSECDMKGADLLFASIWSVDLARSDLSQASLGGTILAAVDLGHTEGLGHVVHKHSSHIDTDTLLTSTRSASGENASQLNSFLRKAGIPGELLDALPSIIADVQYYNCFISYGKPDLRFAKKLCADLEARGISCWLYELDKTPGECTWGEIGVKRQEADKMVLLCSARALVRDGVLKEIEEQIDESADKIIPVSLDDLWRERGFKVQRGDNNLKPFLLDKNCVDFANKARGEALEELLRGLKRPAMKKPRKKRG